MKSEFQPQEAIQLQEGVWLVKVPNYVYNTINSSTPGSIIGKLDIFFKKSIPF